MRCRDEPIGLPEASYESSALTRFVKVKPSAPVLQLEDVDLDDIGEARESSTEGNLERDARVATTLVATEAPATERPEHPAGSEEDEPRGEAEASRDPIAAAEEEHQHDEEQEDEDEQGRQEQEQGRQEQIAWEMHGPASAGAADDARLGSEMQAVSKPLANGIHPGRHGSSSSSGSSHRDGNSREGRPGNSSNGRRQAVHEEEMRANGSEEEEELAMAPQTPQPALVAFEEPFHGAPGKATSPDDGDGDAGRTLDFHFGSGGLSATEAWGDASNSALSF
jgi:hypothetical protein